MKKEKENISLCTSSARRSLLAISTATERAVEEEEGEEEEEGGAVRSLLLLLARLLARGRGLIIFFRVFFLGEEGSEVDRVKEKRFTSLSIPKSISKASVLLPFAFYHAIVPF